MNLARRRPWTNAFSREALCTRVLESYRASIRVQKPRLAVANLVRVIDATLAPFRQAGFYTAAQRQLAEAIDGLSHFASAALSRGNRIGGCTSAGLRARPNPIAHA